jgi:integrase
VWSKNPKIERDYLKIRSKPKFGWEPKTKGSERDVPIHHEYRDILHKMWQYGEGKSNFFLFTQLKHNRLSPAELSSYTKTLFKRLGFPAKELSLHSGRHTYATRIKDGGGSLNMASKSLGHSNTKITEEIYTEFINPLKKVV